MNEIDVFRKEYKKIKDDLLLSYGELKKHNLFELSSNQFNQFNQNLKEMSEYKRSIIINEIITRSIYFKMYHKGYDPSEIKKICKQISINWHLIIMNNQKVSVDELIANSIECWERKEKKLKEIVEKKEKKSNIIKRQISGALRLSASGAIIALDSKMLIENPSDSIFLSSFWASAVIFFQGFDRFFDV